MDSAQVAEKVIPKKSSSEAEVLTQLEAVETQYFAGIYFKLVKNHLFEKGRQRKRKAAFFH